MPRYHFASSVGTFWEREPFAWSSMAEAGRLTAWGRLEGPEKRSLEYVACLVQVLCKFVSDRLLQWSYAFSIEPSRPSIYPSSSVLGRWRYSLRTQGDWAGNLYAQGHIFLLTDLFLIFGRMSDVERAAYGPDGPEMLLCYPPLAGKHLIVSDVAGPPGGGCISTVCKTLHLSQNTSSRLSSWRKRRFTYISNPPKERTRCYAAYRSVPMSVP
jgi:hypothetical protein